MRILSRRKSLALMTDMLGSSEMDSKKRKRARLAPRKRAKIPSRQKIDPPLQNRETSFLIVGMGASAGGLKAFEYFFSKDDVRQRDGFHPGSSSGPEPCQYAP